MNWSGKLIFLIFVFFSNAYLVSGQYLPSKNPYVDSLRQELQKAAGREKVDVLNKLSYNFYFFYPDSTRYYASRAMKLAESIGYKEGLSEAQMMMGVSYTFKNTNAKALSWLRKGLETARSVNHYQGIADNLKNLAVFYLYVEYYRNALDYFKNSIFYQKKAKNPIREAILYSNLGSVYLSMNNADSALYYFNKSSHLFDSLGNHKWDAMVLNDFGEYYVKIKQPLKAISKAEKALAISKKEGQQVHQRNAYQILAESYLQLKQYEKASDAGNKALKLSLEMDFLPYLIQSYKTLFDIENEQKHYENALVYLEKYSGYRDSLRAHQINFESGLLKYQQDIEKVENENSLLRRESALQDKANKAIIRQRTFLVIAISVILMLVSVLALIFFRLRQKEKDINIRLSQSNKELEGQKEQLSASLQMVEHLNAHLQAQNNTINKIAIVSITDLQGNIISVNNNFCEVSGFSRDELIGQNHKIIRSDEHPPEFFEDLWKTINSGNTWRGELKNKRKNGEYFWCDTAIAPIFDDEGNPKQFFSLQFEITARKNYLSDLVNKSRELEELNKLKDKILSVVSHDFRSPLNSLRGTLSLFLRGALSPEEMQMLAKDLVEKLDHTHNLLENLLHWAKSQMQGLTIYTKKLNLRTISEDSTDLLMPLADKKYLKIKNNIDPEYRVYADNEMVKLVFRNLLSNAIKFSPSGEEIVIDASHEDHHITIAIKDNGIGISNENQEKLFKQENFTTTGTSNERGMGIGLLLCKDFVEKNGGSVWFESELGKGSIFYFTLPTGKPSDETTVTNDIDPNTTS